MSSGSSRHAGRGGIALSLALAGCAPTPQTEIVVVVSSDLPRGTGLQSVRVIAQRSGAAGPLHDVTYRLGDTRYPLPGELTLVARDPDDNRPLTVQVIGEAGARTLQQEAVARFQRERTLYLQMTLSSTCFDRTCPTGETCRLGDCARVDQPPLSESRPTTLRPGDASIAPDAPSDVGVVDAASDAVAPADAPDAAIVADAADAADAPPAMDIPDAPPVMDIADVTPAMDVADVPPAMDVADAPPVMDIADVTPAMDVADVTPAMDVADAADAPRSPAVVEVAAGFAHTCALLEDGTIRCWGDNQYLQLGDARQGIPARDAAVTPRVGLARAITAGANHTCALLRDGRVQCWGENGLYLPLGRTDPAPTADPVTIDLAPAVVESVVTVLDRTCALLRGGEIRCWGAQRATPSSCGTAGEFLATRLVGNGRNLCGYFADGYRCLNDAGAAGTDSNGRPCGQWSLPFARGEDRLPPGFDTRHFCTIVAREGERAGSVSCRGSNAEGELGVPSASVLRAPAETPVAVPGLADVAELVGGEYFTCARRVGGQVWCWGNNASGAIGQGDTAAVTSPSPVLGPAGGLPLTGVTRIFAGYSRVYALRDDGSLWAWGLDERGALGDRGLGTVSATPVPTVLPTGVAAVDAVVLSDLQGFARVAASERALFRWGYFDDGGGVGIVPPTSSSSDRSFALQRRFSRYCQTNGGGRMACDRSAPEDIPSGASEYENRLGRCFRMSNGDLRCADCPADTWCFGGGSGATSTRVLSGIQAMAAGESSLCVLLGAADTPGMIQCSGVDAAGQLGDGRTAGPRVGVAFMITGGARQIAAGNEHFCAVSATGGVWCWGRNEAESGGVVRGVFASPATPSQATPLRIADLLGLNVIAVAPGAAHTCALVDDGRVLCWGHNASGQLGDGTFVSRTQPQPVPGLSDARAIDSGAATTCAVRASGALVCWGDNSLGRLGAGAAWRTRPSRVSLVTP